jgi:hypothetical protein
MSFDFKSALDAVTGNSRTGVVNLRSFDEGVVLTLGGSLVTDPLNMTGYYLKDVTGIDDLFPTTGNPTSVEGPSGWQGVPVVFAMPEDKNAKFKLPMVLIRRDSVEPAMNRWHPRICKILCSRSGC